MSDETDVKVQPSPVQEGNVLPNNLVKWTHDHWGNLEGKFTDAVGYHQAVFATDDTLDGKPFMPILCIGRQPNPIALTPEAAADLARVLVHFAETGRLEVS